MIELRQNIFMILGKSTLDYVNQERKDKMIKENISKPNI